MNQVNYDKELQKKLESPDEKGKSILLHSCCAPCSSYVMEYLSSYYKITVFYYNPNITDREEYFKRVAEEQRLIKCYNQKAEEADKFQIEFLEGNYEPEKFLLMSKGMEMEKEGGKRCAGCFAQRLSKTAMLCKQLKMDYFATTLTISPLKNAEVINLIGMQIAEREQVTYLPSDFKKQGGYLRSIELSKEYELYRQNYCGCEFSRVEILEKA